MKKLKFIYYLIAASLIVSCGSDDSDAGSEGSIVPDFSFTSDGSTFTFTNLSEGATSYKWDFGDLYFYSYEESPIYTYDIKGGELTVTLTAYDEAGNEAYVSKPIIAPEVIITTIIIDGEFEEWDVVPLGIEFPGATIQKMKFYTRGTNISIYFEGGSDMTFDVIDMLFNTDENGGTGYNERWMSIGADYLFEGSVIVETDSPGLFSHAGGGGFAWNSIGASSSFETSGLVNIDTETNAIEMTFPKSLFGALGDTIDLGIWLNYGAEFFPPDTAGEPISIGLN